MEGRGVVNLEFEYLLIRLRRKWLIFSFSGGSGKLELGGEFSPLNSSLSKLGVWREEG